MRIKSSHLITGALLCALFSSAQEPARTLRNPFAFPILLSGNFGELRSNHFHSGIDFKTQGAEGKPIHAPQAGYVSRIAVSPWGYGNALYLTHPDGTTTVYGHLLKFAPKIAAYLKERQYAEESFRVDLTLTPDQLPVEQDEVVALSGNTGSSAGPHLHFEVRDTETEEVLDPLPYFMDRVKDTRPPKIQGVMVVPVPGKGAVNGQGGKVKLKVVTDKSGQPALSGKIEAWGEIGLAIKAYDYMDQTGNIYGVRTITLEADGKELFHSDLDRFAFDETRYINSLTDYEEWSNHRSFYMRSYVEPGNRLRFLRAENRGILRIDEPRVYQLTYTLADLFGNTTRLSLRVAGKEQPIHQPDTTGREPFHWNSDNRFGAKGIRLHIPRGNLYDDLAFRYSAKKSEGALASTHRLHDHPVPLHRGAHLSLFLDKDTLADKRQYGIVRISGGRPSWVGGSYRNGWIDADIKELGREYTIRQDVTPPSVIPLNPQAWTSKRMIQLRLSDDLSGVDRYRGEIDGQFALFEMNSRSVVTYRFDPERLERGRHQLRLVVADACGNETVYTHAFSR